MNIDNLKVRLINKYNLFKELNTDPLLNKNLGDWLRMELTYTSNAIEGNTLTRQETKLIHDEGISVGGKSVIEILEVKNHKRALEQVIGFSKSKKLKDIVEQDLLDIHSTILDGIDYYNSGKYRNVPVRISGSQTILPNYLKLPELMRILFEKINSFEKVDSIIDFIDLAVSVHYDLVTIHPFVDGNGRAARLMFNLILLHANLPLSFISKEERKEYLNSLEKAQTGGANSDYKTLMYKSIERSLDFYINKGEIETDINADNTLYKIGQIAKLCNEQIPTIRHWMSLGLIKPFNTTPSGYSLFKSDTIGVIKQIRYLQEEKRLNLNEIKDLLE
jgi:Fic family protein